MVRAHGKFHRIILFQLQATKSISVSFIVYKTSGQRIEIYEAVDLLSCLGEVAKAEPLLEEIQTSLQVPPAVIASYKMYDPKRDVVHVSPILNLSLAFTLTAP
jgi:hypothetical protein